MKKYSLKVDEDFRDKLIQRLRNSGVDEETLEQTTDYLYKNAQIMDRLIEGFDLWVHKGAAEIEMDACSFIAGILVLLDMFRKNMEKNDGIMEQFVSRIYQPPPQPEQNECLPWQYEGHAAQYDGLRGVSKSLYNMGLKQDLVDRFYLDGSLIEIYEDCIEVIFALESLNQIEKPSPYDLREGLFVIEQRFRNFYTRMFMDKICGEDIFGFYGCMEESAKLIKSEGGL